MPHLYLLLRYALARPIILLGAPFFRCNRLAHSSATCAEARSKITVVTLRVMACSEQSLVVGTSVTKHFNERHSQLSELVKEDVDIHFAPAQATGRPDISGGAGGGEPLTLLSLTTPEPHQETVIADTNWPPSSMVVSGTPAAPQRLNTPQDTSKEEPPLSSEQGSFSRQQ